MLKLLQFLWNSHKIQLINHHKFGMYNDEEGDEKILL